MCNLSTAATQIRRILLLAISIACIVCCAPPEKDYEKGSAMSDTVRISEFKSDSCTCELPNRFRSYEIEISFHRYDRYLKDIKLRNNYQFEKYADDSLRAQVKSISFFNYDTIPDRLRVFENVEKVKIWDSFHGIKGLDIFPRLKEVELFLSNIWIDSTERWPLKIQVFHDEKSDVADLQSFRKMPRLVSLKMIFSGFDKFPSDLESLDCLTEVELGAYRNGEVDLAEVDLKKFRCLKKATFHTWYKSITGVPQGLEDTTRTIELEVVHDRLTIKEKRLLKKYASRKP